MKSIFRKHHIEKSFSYIWLIIGIVIFFYGLFLKKNIVSSAQHLGLTFNNWDITLRLMNDMYLIIYFITPLTLFISAKVILESFNQQILIRLGSYKNWIYYSLFRFWTVFFPLLFVWVLLSVFIIIGFPQSWEWSSLSAIDGYGNPLFQLAENFRFPLIVLLEQILLIILAISFMHIVLSAIYALTKKSMFLIVINISVFLGGIISFKMLPPKLSALFPSTYLSIAKIFNVYGSVNLLFIFFLIIVLASILMLINTGKIKKNINKDSILRNLPLVIYLVLCLTGLIVTSYSYSNLSVWDICLVFLGGVSADNFSYVSFFSYSIVYFGFIYLIQLFFSKEIDQIGYYKIIRYRSLYKWFWSWMKVLIFKIILFLSLLIVLTLVTVVIVTGKFNFQITLIPTTLFEILYHYFINGFLQISFYVLILFIVTWVSKESIHGVVLLSIFMVLMFPGINFTGLIPVGLNSFVYLFNSSPFFLTNILLIMNLLVCSIIYYLFKKSLKI